MAPLEASSGAAPDSRQRPPSAMSRAGAGRGRSSAVVLKVTLWFLIGDTRATQYDKVSPESRAGRLNVSHTETPLERFSGGYASGCAGFWHNLRIIFTTEIGLLFHYYLADADLLLSIKD